MSIMDPLWGLFWILGLAVLVVEAWAFIDALTRPAQAYVAADKQSKNLWLALLGIALALNLLMGVGGSLSIFVIAGLIVALIYLLDVRPAVRGVQRPGGSGRGPYGPR